MLRELKSRKAKFGFAKDYVSVNDFIPLGKLMSGLYNTYTDADYITEMVGLHGNDFRLYTDNWTVAAWVRENFVTLDTEERI